MFCSEGSGAEHNKAPEQKPCEQQSERAPGFSLEIPSRTGSWSGWDERRDIPIFFLWRNQMGMESFGSLEKCQVGCVEPVRVVQPLTA